MIRGRRKGSQARAGGAKRPRGQMGPRVWSHVVHTCLAGTAALCTRASSGAGPGPAQLGPAFPCGCLDAHPAWPRLAQSLMLARAKECWDQELEEREAEKKRYLAERVPALQTRGLSLSALQVGASGRRHGGGRWGCDGVGVEVSR